MSGNNSPDCGIVKQASVSAYCKTAPSTTSNQTETSCTVTSAGSTVKSTADSESVPETSSTIVSTSHTIDGNHSIPPPPPPPSASYILPVDDSPTPAPLTPVPDQKMDGFSFSDVLCLFCCPPLPGPIAAKLAFLPPEPTYNFLPDESTSKFTMSLTERAEWQYSHRELEAIDVFYANTNRNNRIGCLFIRSPNSKFTILFSHGNAVDLGQMSSFYLTLGARINCNIFSYDYSGYGVSSGTPSEKNIYADIDAAWHALRSHYGISPENIILYGQSIGTGNVFARFFTLFLSPLDCTHSSPVMFTLFLFLFFFSFSRSSSAYCGLGLSIRSWWSYSSFPTHVWIACCISKH